jgi:hypothetical protein
LASSVLTALLKWAVNTLKEVCHKEMSPKTGEPVRTKTEAAVAATRGKCSTSGLGLKNKRQ